MVMNSPMPMAIFRGVNFEIEMANIELFKNIWGKEEKEIIGKQLFDVFPKLKQQPYPEIFSAVLKKDLVIRKMKL